MKHVACFGAVTGIAIALASLTASGVAGAQTSAQDSAVAQSLYDQGRKFAAAGKYADACPKLEESQRLDPTAVTQFWLADCYEHVGRTASAWSSFLDLASTEHKNGGPRSAEREKVARDRATALQPKLTQLVITVPAAARAPGLTVKRDGEAVHDGQWGTPVPVDPGNHSIEVSAPGKQTSTKTQDVEGVGQTVSVSIDALADTPAPPPVVAPPPGDAKNPPDVPPETQTKASPLKTVGLVVGAVGIVGLGVGTVFGVMALGKNSDANNGHCGGSLGGANSCDATGVSLRSDAVNDGNISTVGIIAGGVLLAGGAALWLFAPSSSVQVAPTVGQGGGGLIARGEF